MTAYFVAYYRKLRREYAMTAEQAYWSARNHFAFLKRHPLPKRKVSR